MEKEGKFFGVVEILKPPRENTQSWTLGPVNEMLPGKPTDTMIFCYVFSEQKFYLSGQRDNGNGVIACWHNVDNIRGVMTLVNAAFTWEQLEKYIQPEYKPLILLQGSPEAKGDRAIIVENKKDAEYFYDFWGKWYQEQKGK